MRELRKGATLLPQSTRRAQLEQSIGVLVPSWFAGRIIPVTQAIADNGMIAATTLEHGLTLVTRNVKDFAGLGAAILNPWDAI